MILSYTPDPYDSSFKGLMKILLDFLQQLDTKRMDG